MTYCKTREYEQACDAFDQLLALSERAPYFLGWRALACRLAGRPNDVLQLAAEIAARQTTEYVHPLAGVLAGIGGCDRVATAKALNGYIAAKGAGFQVGHIVPFLGDWIFEPPFPAVLGRLHLPPAPEKSGPRREFA